MSSTLIDGKKAVKNCLKKDVEGMRPENFIALLFLLLCTLHFKGLFNTQTGATIKGAHVVIISSSVIVGKS